LFEFFAFIKPQNKEPEIDEITGNREIVEICVILKKKLKKNFLRFSKARI